MKKTTVNAAKKLQLEKITLIKLDPDKLRDIWGGTGYGRDNPSGRPECVNSGNVTKPTVKDKYVADVAFLLP